jgi:lipoyl(octanoyl) transferase
MRSLEEAVILTLAEYSIPAERIEGLTGVWVPNGTTPQKICALGVKTSRWVTMHGFAFNVNTDLNYFNHIVPCGIRDKEVTSMAQLLGASQDIKAVALRLKNNIARVFGIEWTE